MQSFCYAKVRFNQQTNSELKHLTANTLRKHLFKVNSEKSNSEISYTVKQLFRVMKLTTLILLIGCLVAGARGHSQKVTLSLKNVPVQTVFREIIRQTGISILYNETIFEDIPPVTIEVKNAGINEVMDKCLPSQSFSYALEGNSIVVRKTTTRPNLSGNNDVERPPIEVSGKVLDDKGNPLGGVTVAIKNDSQVTITDGDGIFTVTSPNQNPVLVFSYVGYKTQELTVADVKNILVRLELDVQKMSELIAIGYGSVQKRKITSAVSSVKAADIKNLPLTSFDQMLQGLSTGVYVSNSSGAPGKPVSMTIRGRNSINIGDPLIVIDGTPVISQSLGSSFGVDNRLDPLSGINPSDIASIEILKDAGAAAIYGSRAANGVILVTTKRGKEGKTIFSIDGYQGTGTPTGKLHLLGTDDYLKLRREAYLNDNVSLPTDLQKPDSIINTNWQDLIYKPTSVGEYKLSMNGGTKLTRFYLSSSYRKETNPLSGEKGLQRGTFRINLDHQATDRITVGTSIGVSRDVNQNTSDAASTYSPVDAALLAPPNMKPYDSAGNFTVIPMPYGVGNPIAIFQSKISSNTTQIKSSLNLNYNIGYGLSLHGDFGYDFNSLHAQIFFPKAVNSVLQNTLFDGSIFTNQTNSFSIEPQLRYDNTFNKHEISAVLGSTLQKRTSLTSTLYGKGFPSDDLQQLSAAATTDGSSSKVEYAFNSLFGRLNYSYATKYIVSATLRRDGSSRFGPNHKYGNFWSAGAGWLFSREGFLVNNKILSLGKLRASYGIVGSDALADFTYLDQYQPYSYGGQTGVRPLTAESPDVRWEQTSKLNVGTDLAFFNGRIAITFDYFKNKTTNLLITKTLPSQIGFTSIQDNLPAEVQNSGYEIELSATAIQSKSFKWVSKFNLTHEKNVLEEFPGLDKEDSYYKFNFKVGQPLNLIWGYKFLGIDPATGTPMYDGFNLDGTKKTPTDPFGGRQIIGNYSPKYYGGFINNFNYKGFSLEVFFQFVDGLASLNGLYDLNNSSGTTNNQVEDVLNRWQKPGMITNVPRLATSSTAWWISSSIDRQSSRFLSDASYVRLKNATLAYDIPSGILSRLKIRSMNVYVTGHNLVTWTKFNGIDPETGSNVAPVQMLIGGIRLGL
jgi:TonB-linked SusC/RagA family outer membrane protein